MNDNPLPGILTVIGLTYSALTQRIKFQAIKG